VYDVTSFAYADSAAQNMLNEVGLCSAVSKSNVRYPDTSTTGNPMTVAYAGRVGIFRFYAPLEGLVGGVNPGGADFYLNGTPALSPQGSPYMRLAQDPVIMGSSSAAYSSGYALDKIFDRSVRVDGNGYDEYAVATPGQCHVDLDFGAPTLVQFVDVWNRTEKQITAFSLVFSNNADFSSPLATVAVSGFQLATLVDVTGQGPGGTDLTARYLRFQSTATSGNQYSGVGELAFYAVVPEPTALALLALAAAWGWAGLPRRTTRR
jgi:hypothetical protein